MNFSFVCLHYMVVCVVYLFLDGTLSCFSALNPDKWLEFKLQEKATVSHNSQLFR
jgi:cytochrome-b5 reductase